VIAASLGVIWLAAATGAGLAAIGALLRWPPARSRIVARASCVITPHRIRPAAQPPGHSPGARTRSGWK
jgi:hypothetical protein